MEVEDVWMPLTIGGTTYKGRKENTVVTSIKGAISSAH